MFVSNLVRVNMIAALVEVEHLDGVPMDVNVSNMGVRVII